MNVRDARPLATVIMPIKCGPGVKSRLHPDPVLRAAFARAFALDTANAALQAAGVARVVVVTKDVETAAEFSRLGCQILREDDSVAGDRLNTAISQGRAWAERLHRGDRLAVLPGDLPALTSAALDDFLDRARPHRLAFSADTAGTGTTMLVGADPHALKTAYGVGSAAKHRALGALELTGLDPRVRRDVDTTEDLLSARRLGLGPATAAIVADLPASVLAHESHPLAGQASRRP